MYADFLTFRLDQTSALLVERANALYRERWGLDVRSLRVLRLVCSEPGVTPKAISQRTLIEKTLLSKTLAALASRGLIERRAHACDGRQFALHPTTEGRRIARASHKAGLKLEAELCASLAPSERATLGRLLARLSNALVDPHDRRAD